MHADALSCPIEVPTRETVAFLRRHLPPASSLIEVGCGAGDVAASLVAAGHDVLGVDTSEEAVEQARARGVNVVCASWLELDAPPADAVVFTRSLHHIDPLAPAVEQARKLMRTPGVLLVEDFAWEEVDAVTLKWFVGVLASSAVASLVQPVPDELVTELNAAADPVAAWKASHDHDLHDLPAMVGAVEELFDVREVATAPYLYRYLVRVLPDTPAAAQLVEDVRREEVQRGERGDITLAGRRIVGAPR